MKNQPCDDSFHVIFSSVDALKGRQQPVPLSTRIAQPLIRHLHIHQNSQSINQLTTSCLQHDVHPRHQLPVTCTFTSSPKQSARTVEHKSGSHCTLVCSMVRHAVHFSSTENPDLIVADRQHRQNQHLSKLYTGNTNIWIPGNTLVWALRIEGHYHQGNAPLTGMRSQTPSTSVQQGVLFKRIA